jgi:hypothetical protein
LEGAVSQKQHKHLFAMCQCGKVQFEAVGPPILTGSCYCTSSQEAGRQFEQLASAPPVLDSDSGTGLILYRKDRVQCMMGQQYLEAPAFPGQLQSVNLAVDLFARLTRSPPSE